MKRTLTVLRHIIRQNVRDTATTLGQMLIFPIVLIFILGMALKPLYGVDKLPPTQVGYLNEDSGFLAGQVEEFVTSSEIGAYLVVQKLESTSQGDELLREGDISAMIHIPPDYSARALAGEKAEISILGHPGRPFEVSLVETVMEAFTYGGNALQALAAMGDPAPQYRPALGSIDDEPLAADGLKPNAMAYYAVTMLVMIGMYGTMYGAFGMSENTRQPVGLRVKASPIRTGELYTGVVLANVATIFTGSLVIMAFTHFFYGVNWGSNLPLVLLIAFLNALLTIGLGTMAMMLIQDENRVSAVLNIFVVASTFLAGGYFKISLPRSIGWVQYLSPNYLAQTAFFNTIYQGPKQQTLLILLAMAGIILVSYGAALAAGRRVR